MIRQPIRQAAGICLLAAGTLFPTQGFSAAPAASGGGVQAALAKECGACHMVFGPAFLPARSWVALMDGLHNHFGENAALDATTRQDIARYLVANAADGPNGNSHYLRGLKASQTPLRITETPYWIGKHREVSAADFLRPEVKSKANCVACHAGAGRGLYEDDNDDD
jgi:hypothetical protein